MGFDDSIGSLLVQIATVWGIGRLRELNPAGLDDELAEAILAEATRFSDEQLAPFDKAADLTGCCLKAGRVAVAPGHKDTWNAFRQAGWVGLDGPVSQGGQGLPRILATAVQECFDRGSVSFGMLPGCLRGAARLLHAHADPALAHMWIPKLVSGEWGATICVSEPDAGSDVGRIRTAARRGAAKRHGGAAWLIRGEKMWISYGDHDLTERIGHIVLARIEGADRGIRGLSLFLVPSLVARPDGSLGANHVIVRRVEEKLGLHGSPTCALGFEDAEGVLIGSEGRGVAQLFSMIVAMRLQVGSQGLGLAEASYRAAFAYAQQRRQGGPADAPPVTIATHADVQLTLVGMASRICTLRGLVYTAAVAADLADLEPDATARESAASLQAWLLPIIKNSAAETSFAIAADAILLFGGAGYTTEWPVERYLRDARVLAIYEGTGGMQALDLVKRRWRVPGTGCEAFLAALDADLVEWPEAVAAPLRAAISTLVDASRWLRDPAREDWEIEAAARAALRLATDVAHGWIGARLATLGETDATHTRLAAYGRHALSVMAESVAASLAAMHSSPARLRNCAGL